MNELELKNNFRYYYKCIVDEYEQRLFLDGININEIADITNILKELEKLYDNVYKEEDYIRLSNILTSLLEIYYNNEEMIKYCISENSLISSLVFANNKNKIIYKGTNASFLCQFHKEKTASMHVNNTKNTFYCYGCGTGGNPFDYIFEFENISVPETISLLAKIFLLKYSEQETLVDESLVEKYQKVLLSDDFLNFVNKEEKRFLLHQNEYNSEKVFLIKQSFKNIYDIIERVKQHIILELECGTSLIKFLKYEIPSFDDE